MFARVSKTITDHDLIDPGNAVLIALSGGPDSVALLDILCRMRKRLKLDLSAVYINHLIRPKAASRESSFCEKLCEKLKVKFISVSSDVPTLAAKSKQSLEQAGREVRYFTFERIAKDNSIDRIVLGHHADDRVETILFRILRGTGISGLKGIPIKRGKIVRPLFYVTKSEILAYLVERNLEFCVDRSNLKTDYRRNRIRLKLLPEIRRTLNPAVDSALLGLGETAEAEDRFLESLAAKAIKKAVRYSPGGKIELDLKLFTNYDLWLRRRLIRYCVTQLSPSSLAPDRKVTERLVNKASTGKCSISIPGGIQATEVNGKLVFQKKRKQDFCEELRSGTVKPLDNPRINLKFGSVGRKAVPVKKKRRSSKVWIDAGSVKLPLTVRSIRPGDRFQPLGMKGSKKVGDYLTDRKLHPVYRDEIPVVCDGEGIVWLLGFEIDERVKIDNSTVKVLQIEYTQRKR